DRRAHRAADRVPQESGRSRGPRRARGPHQVREPGGRLPSPGRRREGEGRRPGARRPERPRRAEAGVNAPENVLTPPAPCRFRRGAAILPSVFTTGNLFLGFWAIVKTIDGHPAEAAPLIAGAIVLDMLDGRIARLTGTTSEFGGELDSLADVVSFGVAPAIL